MKRTELLPLVQVGMLAALACGVFLMSAMPAQAQLSIILTEQEARDPNLLNVIARNFGGVPSPDQIGGNERFRTLIPITKPNATLPPAQGSYTSQQAGDMMCQQRAGPGEEGALRFCRTTGTSEGKPAVGICDFFYANGVQVTYNEIHTCHVWVDENGDGRFGGGQDVYYAIKTADNRFQRNTHQGGPGGARLGQVDEPPSDAGEPTEVTPEAVSQTNALPDDSCDLFDGNIAQCIGQFAGKILASVMLVIVRVAGAILGIVGSFFNWVMVVTVFQFSVYFGNSEGMLTAWSVLRDIANIVLLFGFIFIGIQTVLNLGNIGIGKALPRLVIVAVLINFSLFAAEAVVDVSNAFSSVFYEQAGQGSCAQQSNAQECLNQGISSKVMTAAGVSSLANIGDRYGEIWRGDGVTAALTYTGMLIFMSILIVVLLIASLMFVARAIILMFLLVTSPAAFAMMAIPQLSGKARLWWNTLFSQAFFAPVFLLLLLVSLKILETARDTFNPNGNSDSLTSVFVTGGVSGGGVILLYALVIGFLIASLMAAKQVSSMGAGFVVNRVHNGVTRIAGGAVFGGTGFVGRRTVGLGAAGTARHLMNNPKYAKFRASGMGRMTMNTLNKAASSSYDGRASGVVKSVAKSQKLNLGERPKGAKDGIAGIVKRGREKHEKYANTLNDVKEGKKEHARNLAGLHEVAKSHEETVGHAADAKEAESRATETMRRDVDNLRTRVSSGTASKEALRKAEENLKKQEDVLAIADASLAKVMADKAAADKALADAVKNGPRTVVKGNDLKEKYATGIEKPWFGERIATIPTLRGRVASEAADNIRKGRNKSKLDSALEQLKDGVKEESKKEDEGKKGDEKKDDKDSAK